MPISKGKKRLATVVLVIYLAFIAAFIVKTRTFEAPENRAIHVRALIAASQKHAGKGEAPLNEKTAGEVYDRHVSEKGNIIGVNYTMVMQMLNFAVFLMAFYVFLWDPMVNVLDARRAKVRENIESADEARREAQDEKKEAARTIQEARRDRMELRELAQHEADEDRQEIVAEAHRQAERLMKETQRRIEAEADEARGVLRREIGDMAVEVARRLLQRELTEQDHDRLVDELIAELESETPKAQDGTS